MLGRFGKGVMYEIRNQSLWSRLVEKALGKKLKELVHPQSNQQPKSTWFKELFSVEMLSAELSKIVINAQKSFLQSKGIGGTKLKDWKGIDIAKKIENEYFKEFKEYSSKKMVSYINKQFLGTVQEKAIEIFNQMTDLYFSSSNVADDPTKFTIYEKAIKLEVKRNVESASELYKKSEKELKSEKLISDAFLGFGTDAGDGVPMHWAHFFIAGHLSGNGSLLLWMNAENIKKIDNFIKGLGHLKKGEMGEYKNRYKSKTIVTGWETRKWGNKRTSIPSRPKLKP